MKIQKLLDKSQFTVQGYLTPNWVGNGHWIAKYRECGYKGDLTRADLVKLFPPKLRKLIASDDPMVREFEDDRAATSSFPHGELRAFRRLNRMYINHYGIVARVFAADDGTLALFQDSLVEASGVMELYTDTHARTFINAPVVDDVTFLIAPMLPREITLAETTETIEEPAP